MSAVKVKVAGARSVETVGHGIAGRLRITAGTRVALAEIKRVSIIERVDLIQKGQFDDVAKFAA